MSGDSDTPSSADLSTGELISQLSEQTSTLVRSELQLAKVELTNSAKHAGLGAGLFSVAGVLTWFGLGALIATAIIALGLVLPLWASALIVTLVLFLAAGIAALVGKKQVQQVTPTPERTVENVKLDVQEVKESRSHDHTS
ncbi:MAG: phage holin family protein [Dermatophilaceae bacterium]|nr:phage holin family protein [Dermatophilaceae bacterium]